MPKAGFPLITGALVKTGLVAGILVLVGKLTAFGWGVAMTYYFGAGIDSDAYFIANTIPGLLWGVFFVTINVAFLPVYARARLAGGSVGQELINEAIQIYSLLALILTLIGVVTAPHLVRLISPNVSKQTAELATSLTMIMSLGFVFSGYVAIQSVIQQTTGRYLAPLMVPLVNNIIAIIGIVIAAVFSDIAIAACAAVGAWVVQALIQRVQNLQAYKTSCRLEIRSDTICNLALLSTPIMLATLLDQVNLFLGTYLAGNMGEGVISQLNYASRLALLASGTVSTLISYFLFPKVATAVAQGDPAELSRVVGIGLLAIVGTTLPLALLSVLLRHEIVAIVYGHGATTTQTLLATAAIYAAFAVGLLFMAVREFINRIFFSFQRNMDPLLIGVVASVANVVISIWLAPTLGAVGIALGASLGAAVYFTGQIFLLRRIRSGIIEARLWADMGVVALATLPAWLVASWAHEQLEFTTDWARLIAVGSLFMAIFAVGTFMFSRRLRVALRTGLNSN